MTFKPTLPTSLKGAIAATALLAASPALAFDVKDMTKAEARLADNGSEQTVDRLHRSMSRFDLRTA